MPIMKKKKKKKKKKKTLHKDPCKEKKSVFYKCFTLQNILKHGYVIIEYNMLRYKELFDLRQYGRDKYKMTSR